MQDLRGPERADAALDAEMQDWLREVSGATELRIERRSGGASRLGYAVDATAADGTTRALWLRMDSGTGPQSNTGYSVRREAAVYREVARTPVRVPEVVAVHPTRDAFVAERLEGRNWFSEITDPAEADSTARDFVDQLAALHRVDPADLDLPELGPPTTITAHLTTEIDNWEGQYRGHDEPEPVVELALRWLRDRRPPDGDWPLVLVQGDTGPGNFMYAGGRVVAVMDWEMAHWGDLHDDLGWLCVRDLQERFTDLAARLADYEAALGRAIDLDRLRYYRVLAQARCAIGTLNGLYSRDPGGEVANHLLYSTLHLRMLSEALAEAMGRTVDLSDAVLDDPGESELTWLYDVALTDLRAVIVPAIDDPFALRRAKGLARLVKHLRDSERLGSRLDDAEVAEIAALVGHPVEDRRAGRRELCEAIEDGRADAGPVLDHCVRHWARVTEARRPLMGALADRHYAPVAAPTA